MVNTMKKILALTVSILVFGGSLANANAAGNADRPDFTKEAPKSAKSDYEKFHDFVKERVEKPGLGVDYDSKHKAPIITYEWRF